MAKISSPLETAKRNLLKDVKGFEILKQAYSFEQRDALTVPGGRRFPVKPGMTDVRA